MPTTVLLFLVPICHIGLHLPLVMNGAKMTGKAPVVWVLPVLFLLLAGLYWSYSISWTHKDVVAAINTTVLLFLVPIWHRGLHLPLVKDWVKVTEEAHVWVPQQCVKWCSWSISLIIIHVLNSQICGCCNAHHCVALPFSCLSQRPSFATGDEWSQNDWKSTTCMGTVFSYF
jgi:hypothetical protein